jgi:hypothetical protein
MARTYFDSNFELEFVTRATWQVTLVDQQLLPFRSINFFVVFVCRFSKIIVCPFVLFLLDIVLSVLLPFNEPSSVVNDQFKTLLSVLTCYFSSNKRSPHHGTLYCLSFFDKVSDYPVGISNFSWLHMLYNYRNYSRSTVAQIRSYCQNMFVPSKDQATEVQ